MNYTIKITDKYLHEIIDTLEKVVADRDGDMLLMSRIEYADRLSSKVASHEDGYPRDFLYNIVYYAILQNLRYKTIVYLLYIYGWTVTGPEVENYEFLKS